MRTPDITEMKSAQYSQMVADRKACTLCLSEDFKNPADPDLREWDSSHIGPWTRWLGDLNARLMVVGQEWGDTNAFKNQHGLDQPRSATNTRLRQLLSSVGIHVPDVSECSGQSGVFLTNAALCLKRGGCQARVRSEWFTNCGRTLLRRQIDLVDPRVVVTLGHQAYVGVCTAYAMKPVSLRAAVESAPVKLPNGSVLVPVYHCSARVRNRDRDDVAQAVDWQRVRDALTDSAATPVA